MGISRYPRPGHKISPDLLAPVLEVPIPWRLINQERELAGMLSELDENVWKRWSPNVCAKLGAAVVREISSRIASLPPEILDQKLPMPEDVLREHLAAGLEVLPLEARTYNCLVAEGIADSPERLAQLTIADLLKIRSFGAKSLVDLLATLESLAEGPDAVQAHEDISLPSIPTLEPKVSRYPRPGHRLAPECLAEVLDVPIPSSVRRRWNLERETLSELDESIWEDLDTTAIHKLGELVVQQLDSCLPSLPPNIIYQHLPVPEGGLGLQNLEVERRTYNCLEREGVLANPGRLLTTTIGDLLEYRGVGGKSLVDFLSALEYCHPLPVSDEDLPASSGEAAREILGRLEARLEGAFVGRDDPRVGTLLRTLDPTASSLKEVFEANRGHRYSESQLKAMEPGLGELENELRRAGQAILRDELAEIASTGLNERDSAIIGRYFGWDGDGPQTLKQIGEQFDLTRERVRQIGVEQAQRIARTAPYAPTLRRALRTLADRTPVSDREARDLLAQLGIEDSDKIGLRTLRQAARLLEIELPFALIELNSDVVAVPAHTRDAVDPMLRSARRVADTWGIANVDEVMADSGRASGLPSRSMISALLSCFDDFDWLDDDRTWFWIPNGRNRLREHLAKAFAFQQEISAEDLREALMRTYRKHELAVPQEVLFSWLERLPEIQRRDSRLVWAGAEREDSAILSGTELCIVELLREHGPVLERHRLEELASRRGIKRSTLALRLDSSPVVLPWSDDRIGLIGTPDRRRQRSELGIRTGSPHRLILEIPVPGTPASGSHPGEIPYDDLNSSMLLGKYRLLGGDGGSLGTLQVREDLVTGLLGLLSQRGGDHGDRVVIDFNLPKRTATANFDW